MPSTVRKQYWCFTVYPAEDKDEQDALNPELWPNCRYCIFQLEIAPKTDRFHYQGYVEFKKPMTRAGIQKLEGLETAHLEVRSGTAEQARDYCRKEETRVDGPYEFGQLVGQGERADCDSVHAYWKAHPEDKPLDIYEKWPRYGFYHGANLERIEKWKEERRPPRDFKTEVALLYGPTGCGKTRTAMDCPAEKRYTKEPDSKWFDGYRGQELCIIDDFKGEINYSKMLRLMDRYDCKVEVKGGMREFTSKKLAITASIPPWQWYSDDVPFNWEEFARRVDHFWIPDPEHDQKFIEVTAAQFKSKYSDVLPRSAETQKLMEERTQLLTRNYHMLTQEINEYNKAISRSIILDKQRAELPVRKPNQRSLDEFL